MECNKVIPLVLDKNQLLFLILVDSNMSTAMIPIITETFKIICRMVVPRVLDENRSLFLNLSQYGLQIASGF